MHPDKQLAQYFLEKIHNYYPIGLPHFEEDYPGYQQLLNIQKEKFEAVQQSEPKAWFDLVEAIKKQWDGYRVTNSIAVPFPSYQLTVELYNQQKPGLWIDSSLVLTVSLLVKYFAIFVVDNYTYQGPENSGVAHKFICSGYRHHLGIESKINPLTGAVQRCFPDYQQARHNVLFNYKVLGGYPFTAGYEDVGEYTIYDYLFSQDFIKQKYTVTH